MAKLSLEMRHNEIAMKRCPKCDFLYLDSDEVCDLDGTALVTTEQHVEPPKSNSQQHAPRMASRSLSALGISGVALAIILFLVYQRATHRPPEPGSNESLNMSAAPPPVPLIQPSPQTSPTTTPEPSVSPVAKASPTARATPSRGGLSSSPVSTTVEEGVQRGVIIRLSDGRSLPADEAWRTKDGIWYRRNGIVTLLKRNQVKAIEKAP